MGKFKVQSSSLKDIDLSRGSRSGFLVKNNGIFLFEAKHDRQTLVSLLLVRRQTGVMLFLSIVWSILSLCRMVDTIVMSYGRYYRYVIGHSVRMTIMEHRTTNSNCIAIILRDYVVF